MMLMSGVGRGEGELVMLMSGVGRGEGELMMLMSGVGRGEGELMMSIAVRHLIKLFPLGFIRQSGTATYFRCRNHCLIGPVTFYTRFKDVCWILCCC